VSGLVASSGNDMISVYTNADTELSPWITPERLTREGALVVWEERGSGPPDKLAGLVGTRRPRIISIPVPRAGMQMPPILIGYAVVPPHS
jgi:hypothetical protein